MNNGPTTAVFTVNQVLEDLPHDISVFNKDYLGPTLRPLTKDYYYYYYYYYCHKPGGARMCQREPGEARKSQGEPGGVRRNQEGPGGASMSQEKLRKPGEARRAMSQWGPGGATESQEEPG